MDIEEILSTARFHDIPLHKNGIISINKKFNPLTIPEVQLTTNQIKEIRENLSLSQTVFAKLLNVSPSSIRQWEQGKRHPTGATQVLLDLLKRSPHILDYRLSAQNIDVKIKT